MKINNISFVVDKPFQNNVLFEKEFNDLDFTFWNYLKQSFNSLSINVNTNDIFDPNNADIIIAHNAFFDRPMVEQHWNCFKKIPWSCTFSSINWLKEGFNSAKLELLGINFGWYYDGHTALNDCEACLALLSETLPKSNKTVLSACREYAINKSYLIRALDAPYDKRQLLRRRGYRWRPADQPNGKVWWKELPSFKEEAIWLNSKIYNTRINIPIIEVTALDRYSDRIWEFD